MSQRRRQRWKEQIKPEDSIRNAITAPNYLEIQYLDPIKGRGIVAKKWMKKGCFVLHYNGKRRSVEPSDDEDDVYLFEIQCSRRREWIDASEDDGSYGRLINDDHINPNLGVRIIKVDGNYYPIFLAKRDISVGEELTYDYGGRNYWWRNEDNLLRKAEGMLPDIKNFLENPGVIKPLPKGNDQHLIPTLLPQKDQGICDQERDCLSNYLCLSFEKLRDPSEDVASLLHATIDFISKHQPENGDESSSALKRRTVSMDGSIMEVSSETYQQHCEPVQQVSENGGESSSALKKRTVTMDGFIMEVSSETTHQHCEPVQQVSENGGESPAALKKQTVSVDGSIMEISSETTQHCEPVQQVSENGGVSPGDLNCRTVSIEGSSMEISSETTHQHCEPVQQVSENGDESSSALKKRTVSMDGSIMEVSSETTHQHCEPVQQVSENGGKSPGALKHRTVSVDGSIIEVSSETTQHCEPVQQVSENGGEFPAALKHRTVSVDGSIMEISSETTQHCEPVQQVSENGGVSPGDLNCRTVSIEGSSMGISSETTHQHCEPVQQVSENGGESFGYSKCRTVSTKDSFMEFFGDTFSCPYLVEEMAEEVDDFLLDYESDTESNDKTKEHSLLYVSSKPNSRCKVVKQIADSVGKSPHHWESEMQSKNHMTDGSPLHVSSGHKAIPLPQPHQIMTEYAEDSESDATSDIVPFTNPLKQLKALNVENLEPDSTTGMEIDDAEEMLTIQVVSQSDKRDYSKRHACFFCGKSVLKIGRHIVTVHSSAPEIATLPSVSKNQRGSLSEKIVKRRKFVLDKYRNLGNFAHNVDVLKDRKGVLFVGRRPSSLAHRPDDYLPCQFCLAFYVKQELWRHAKHCPFRSTPVRYENAEQESKEMKDCISAGKSILQGAIGVNITGPIIDDDFQKYVLDSFHSDEISRSVKSDYLLLMLGKAQLSKLGFRRASQVREKLRIMGRLKLQLRCLSGNESASVEDFITPSQYDVCMTAVKSLAMESDRNSLSGTKTFNKPSLALKAGQLLKKVADLKKGQAIRKKDIEAKEAASEFVDLYRNEFTDAISGIAHQSLQERKFNKKEILPVTSDLIKLTQYLNSEMAHCIEHLQQNATLTTWRNLAEVTLSRLICFNKRRSNEPAMMLVTKFKSRPSWERANQELIKTLKPIEQELMKKMDLVEVLGKKNRKVPVLLTRDMTAAVETLISTREAVGMPSLNPYVFAQGRDSHLRGCDCLRKMAIKCEAEYPELLTSTRLRKYLATVSQVFSLTGVELEELARHMGHELTVHRNFYRLQEDVIELAKVSKLLLAVEEGKAHKFNGLNIDDIVLEDFGQIGVEVMDSNDLIQSEQEDVGLRKENRSDSDFGQIGVEVMDSNDLIQSEQEDVGLEKKPRNDSERRFKRKSASNADDSMKKYQFDAWEENLDTEYDYNPESDSEESEDDDLFTKSAKKNTRKIKETSKKRTVWSTKEKDAILKYLIPHVKVSKKPPTKQIVLRAKSKTDDLNEREWKSVKFQAWAMYQQERKRHALVALRLQNSPQ